MRFLGAEYAKKCVFGTEGAYSAPSDPLGGFNGPTSKRSRGMAGEAEGREKKRKGTGRERDRCV